MTYATDMLVHEHELIQRMIAILQKAADAVEKDNQLSLLPFEQAVDFIKAFADKCHHSKEENILFKLMEQKGMPVNGGPIGAMLHEHQLARNCTAALSAALEKARAGDHAAIAAIIENARYYADLLGNHIAKENNILYPMGNQIFSEIDQNYLHTEFGKVNKEIGEDVHQRFHRMVEQLESAFEIN